MKIDIVTIFPDTIRTAVGYSILARAQAESIVTVSAVDLRDFTQDKRRTVDDAPYGGGAGMVLKPEPVFDAVESLMGEQGGARVLLMTPQGRPFTQDIARELSAEQHLVILCGHYEGFDERIREHLATDEISIGDFVLTGGELPALIIADAVTRLLPGAIGNEGSLGDETFEQDLLEYPQYTRPVTYRGWTVPDVLLSGHHGEIAKWRLERQKERTRARRPDLWARYAQREREAMELAAKERAAKRKRSVAKAGSTETTAHDQDNPAMPDRDALDMQRNDLTEEIG
ncbi:MAG: tRNA (guanosine(37)-N1)-methyltransferase TrmD [Capsulimonadaceae bacterium]|nr:tRNA (guanosine(37)-N1)-methyltransferase TrmD [Capsulimonadaceae bacterium]